MQITREDVERASGVIQARFAMIHGPSHFWDVGTMKSIMTGLYNFAKNYHLR